MNLINQLRMLAEDLHVNGYNRYSAAMSKAADELDKWEAVFGHLGGTPDECGQTIIAAQPVQRFVGRRNAQEREPTMQDALMKFDPATGEEMPYPSHATQWRNWHGIAAWLFDPWTGKRRNAYDVGSDVHGLLIVPTGTLGMDMGGGCAEKNNVTASPKVKPSRQSSKTQTACESAQKEKRNEY